MKIRKTTFSDKNLFSSCVLDFILPGYNLSNPSFSLPLIFGRNLGLSTHFWDISQSRFLSADNFSSLLGHICFSTLDNKDFRAIFGLVYQGLQRSPLPFHCFQTPDYEKRFACF